MKKPTLTMGKITGMPLFAGEGGKGSAPRNPNIGKWTAVAIYVDGKEMPVTDVFENGCSLELKPEGESILTIDGESRDTGWEAIDILTLKGSDDVEIYGRFDEDILNVEFQNCVVEFEQERKPKPPARTDGDPLKGTWKGKDSNGVDAKFVFDGKGNVKLSTMMSQKGTYVIEDDMVIMDLTLGVRKYYFSFDGNNLTLISPPGEYYVNYDLKGKGKQAQSSEDDEGSDDPLKGRWQGEDSNESKVTFIFDGYGGVIFKFISDTRGTYFIEDDIVTMDLDSYGVRSYQYEIKGNTLTLTSTSYYADYRLEKK